MSVVRYTDARPFVLHVNHTGAQLPSCCAHPARSGTARRAVTHSVGDRPIESAATAGLTLRAVPGILI